MTFTEMMMNQRNNLEHPSGAIRKRVTANDVLLHAAPRMVAKPAAYEMIAPTGIFSGSMSW
jgi:hypothetical protein